MKRLIGAVMLAVVALGARAAAAELDNSAWPALETGKKANGETLLFINGQFTSSHCVPWGFSTTPYSAKKEGDAIRWTSTLTNGDGETMAWSGEARGKAMTGQYVYTDKNKKVYTTMWTAKRLEKE
jgi:hypothetical protein